MKDILLGICLFTFSFCLQAQNDNIIPFVVSRGIYTSFTSLRNSAPNRQDSFRLITRTSGDKLLMGGSDYGIELDTSNKEELRALRKALVGISDGKQFYISDKYTVGGWFGLTPCYLKGPLILTLNQGTLGQYTGGLIPSLIKTGHGYVINICTREHVALTRSYLKRLLKNYPDLENTYLKTMDVMDHAVEILQQVNKKMMME